MVVAHLEEVEDTLEEPEGIEVEAEGAVMVRVGVVEGEDTWDQAVEVAEEVVLSVENGIGTHHLFLMNRGQDTIQVRHKVAIIKFNYYSMNQLTLEILHRFIQLTMNI